MLQIDYQRLRSLTTGILHTEIGHVYIDLEIISGEKGLMTHRLPRAVKAVEPWLRKQVIDARFWDGKFDTTHIGVYGLPQPTDEERVEMFKLFCIAADPLASFK